jgi:thymidylate kinase
MNTLIFEGIATSGKSTIIDSLVRSLKDEMSIELATEDQTHEPIMEQRSELHAPFFEELINELAMKRPDLLIFDRLYITQAYRAKIDLTQYSSIEQALMPYNPHTILLKVDEAAVADRIKAAAKHRGEEWVEKYWKPKGDDFEEIARNYIEQQRGLLRLVEQSNIPYTVFDTTDHGYGTIAKDILKLVRNRVI